MSVLRAPPPVLPSDCKVYCIVLKDDDTKREVMETEFESHGMLPHVEWLVRERDTNGMRGCFESHREACIQALKIDGLKAAIIIEDDCVLESNRICTVIDGIRDAIDAIRGGCTICGIGGAPMTRYGNIIHSTMWCRESNWRLTHCYAISRIGCVWMKSRVFRGKHYDYELSLVPGRSALLIHSVAFQRGGYATTTDSSTFYKITHKMRDMVGPRTFQLFLHHTMMFFTRITCRAPLM